MISLSFHARAEPTVRQFDVEPVAGGDPGCRLQRTTSMPHHRKAQPQDALGGAAADKLFACREFVPPAAEVLFGRAAECILRLNDFRASVFEQGRAQVREFPAQPFEPGVPACA